MPGLTGHLLDQRKISGGAGIQEQRLRPRCQTAAHQTPPVSRQRPLRVRQGQINIGYLSTAACLSHSLDGFFGAAVWRDRYLNNASRQISSKTSVNQKKYIPLHF
jgi:hypothetical protein